MVKKLSELGLNPNNSIVVGSGILQALKIRESKDIDLVVSQEAYDFLINSGKFTIHKTQGDRKILKNKLFEIGIDWNVLGKIYKFEDFKNDSVVIDGVRYLGLDFLYRVKKSWLKEKIARLKDINDLKLIEEYMDEFP